MLQSGAMIAWAITSDSWQDVTFYIIKESQILQWVAMVAIIPPTQEGWNILHDIGVTNITGEGGGHDSMVATTPAICQDGVFSLSLASKLISLK